MKKRILLVSFLLCNTFVFCQSSDCRRIPMAKWTSKVYPFDLDTQSKVMVFEMYFNDSVSVFAEGQTIAREFIKTERTLGAAKTVIETSIYGKKMTIFIGKDCYTFHFKKGFKYYYFTRHSKGVGIQYSNYQREYY